MAHRGVDGKSYSEAYDLMKGCTDRDVLKTAHPRLSEEAQARVPGATRIWGSNIYVTPKGRTFHAGGLLNMETTELSTKLSKFKNNMTCFMRFVMLTTTHVMFLYYAPSTFTWRWAAIGYFIYSFGGLVGITLGYHRLLTHKSFKTYKWLEYIIAFVGINGGQGGPIEWVSTHRYHHLHCDTPLDPHSPYEGFWWSHMLWLTGTEYSMLDADNTQDLKGQLYYRVWEELFFPFMFFLKPYLTYKYLGGLPAVIWTMAFPLVMGWHTTFLVNSASHVWGDRPYDTGDLSTNNAVVAALAFGEGWHCNHHAFPYSARHGLESHQFDLTWLLICLLQKLGLAWDVQLPSEKAKALKLKKDPAQAKLAAAPAPSPNASPRIPAGKVVRRSPRNKAA